MPIGRRRAASCRPASPRPWKLYGELRGLNAPPRRILAPARLTAAAVVSTCSSDSAEHGPAMTITSSPPIRTSPTTTTVFSGLKVRLASLYGSRDAQHFVHAVLDLDQLRIAGAVADGANDRARRARRSMHVKPHLDELRDHRLNLRFGCPLLHDDNHVPALCLSRFYRCSGLPPPALRLAAASRSSRRASSMIRSKSRVIASSSAARGWPRARSRAPPPHAPADRSAAPDLLLDLADFERAGGALVQQRDQLRVDLVNPCAERRDPLHASPALQPPHETLRPPRPGPRPARPRSAITCTIALPTTAASANAATSATCSGREMPNPSATGSVVSARMRSTSGRALAATASRVPVTPSREIAYRNPRPSRAASAQPRVGRRRADQKDLIDAARVERAPHRLGLLDRQIEQQHAVDAGVGGAVARTRRRPCRSTGFT